MIPKLIELAGAPWDVLPQGIHKASFEEVKAAFANNPHRCRLFDGLLAASIRLRSAGCLTIYLDGSYVTGKPHPLDFDVCWEPAGVDLDLLDNVFLNFESGRVAQKTTFKGEFFPSSMMCSDVGSSFLDFFQLERHTGSQKGIVSISLFDDPFLLRKAQP